MVPRPARAQPARRLCPTSTSASARADGPDRDRARPGASRTDVRERIRESFGVANFSLRAAARPLDLDAIDRGDPRATSAIAPCDVFRVSARRADKRFPMTSPQIEREVGGRIKEARGWTVDLDEPS